MINSRSLDDLDDIPRQVCHEHILQAGIAGIELIITSTYRDFEAQEALYAIGRTVQPERRSVTNAKAGRSWHQFKCAYDVVPIVAGKPVWSVRDPIWKVTIDLGIAAGAEAGARWKTFPDYPHFQVRPVEGAGKIELAEAMVRFNERGTIFLT